MDERFLNERLARRAESNALRSLHETRDLVDFTSNDYLGFARSSKLREIVDAALRDHPDLPLGSTGSRLLSGHTRLHEEIEEEVATFHRAESSLIFNSGYDANIGLFSSVPQRSDTVLYDQLVHASVRDGVRLGLAKAYSFRHNDLAHLETRLQRAVGTCFVAVESVYSMGGDCAPLREIVALVQRYGAHLIVDEAHATGVFGTAGRGRVVEHSLQDMVFARLHTFGKALGVHGAAVVGSQTLKNYLINFARSFIYTTSLPPHSLVAIRCAYQHLARSRELIGQLHQKVRRFHQAARCISSSRLRRSESTIQSVLVPDNRKVTDLAAWLQSRGFDVRAIRRPTVPAGTERLRICLHVFNRETDITRLTEAISAGLELL